LRAGDGRDPGVAELVEVADGEPRAADVVGGDVARPRPGDVEVDADHGDCRPHELVDLGVVALDAHQDDAVDPVLTCAAEVAVLTPALCPGLLRSEQQQVVSERANALLEADEDALEERVVDVRVLVAGEEDDADDLRALRHERPRCRAGRVVELAGARENAIAGRLAHVVVAVEDPRDGGDRNPASLRNFPDARHFLLIY
jgi:hypothetical protein